MDHMNSQRLYYSVYVLKYYTFLPFFFLGLKLKICSLILLLKTSEKHNIIVNDYRNSKTK